MNREHMVKDLLYEHFARIAKAVSHPRRAELLDLLSQGPRTVETLASSAGMNVTTASHHLQILKATRLVQTRRDGTYIIYSLASDEVLDLWRSVQKLARTLFVEVQTIIDDYLHSADTLESVDRVELLNRIRDGQVTVLDVRPPEEYRAGHIPGATSMPLEELEARLEDLPVDGEIVAYCRGPYCVLAMEAVRILRSRGYSARRLEDGIPDWKARGLPVESTPIQ